MHFLAYNSPRTVLLCSISVFAIYLASNNSPSPVLLQNDVRARQNVLLSSASIQGFHPKFRVRRSAASTARLTLLGEVEDLPDIDEDQQLKDAAAHVQDVYRPFLPAAPAGQYDGFYKAYQDTKLPSEGADGPGHPWRAESESVDAGPPLLPHAYGPDPDYYPVSTDALSTITINANGAGSTNTFNVAGPRAINVQVGAHIPEFDSWSYYYPDGETPVAYLDPSKASVQVEGDAEVTGSIPPALREAGDRFLSAAPGEPQEEIPLVADPFMD